MRTNKKGQVIRISPEVFEQLQRKKGNFRSWDAMLRCLLGMRPRRGTFPTKLHEGYVVPLTGRFFERAAEARGDAVKVAAKTGADKIVSPIRMREVL